jgi:hypothetical protein
LTIRLVDFGNDLPPQPAPPEPSSGFVSDPEYEASPGIKEALEAINGRASAVLIVGGAGTGKTHLIQYLRRRPGGEQTAVVAPTGIAALNAGAQTIHSMFVLPPHVLDARNLPDAPRPGQLLQRMDRLIIDEISMVRADVVDAINVRLQAARRSSKPFGGVQVIMVGDFLQLPPVVDDEERPLLHGLGYRAPYAFNAHVLQDLEVRPISLERVYRQEEQEFIEILARVRLGQDVDQVVALLNARRARPHRAGVSPMLLTPTRAAAERHNRAGLAALDGPSAVFQAEISGEMRVEKDRLPVPERLELRVGARVMAAKNDPDRRWVNGSLGTVTRIEGHKVTVRF